ncbi:MAG: hypothetical protein OXB94_01955, partial [Nitrospira sp.]|nr:hypothetical protein [Nitrospira sp.]
MNEGSPQPLMPQGWTDGPRVQAARTLIRAGGSGKISTAHGPRPTAHGPRPTAHGPRPTAHGPRPTAQRHDVRPARGRRAQTGSLH